MHPDPKQITKAAEQLKNSVQPIIISGGGVLYSEAEDELSHFAKKHNIPVTATAMGIGCMTKDDSHYIGGIGGLGERSANNLSKDTDLALAIGTKLADFTTGSWANFESENFQLVSLNTARFDTVKHLATPIISDAKIGLQQLSEALGDWKAPDARVRSWRCKKEICCATSGAFLTRMSSSFASPSRGRAKLS